VRLLPLWTHRSPALQLLRSKARAGNSFNSKLVNWFSACVGRPSGHPQAVSTPKQSPVLGYGSSESFDGSSGLP
jgi:hypothetical protein